MSIIWTFFMQAPQNLARKSILSQNVTHMVSYWQYATWMRDDDALMSSLSCRLSGWKSLQTHSRYWRQIQHL